MTKSRGECGPWHLPPDARSVFRGSARQDRLTRWKAYAAKHKTRAGFASAGFIMNLRKTCEAGLVNGCFELVLRTGVLEIFQSLLRGGDERAESFRLMDSHVGQNLAVDF